MKRANTLLLLVSTLIALVMVEVGYRFLLSRRIAAEAQAKSTPEFADTFGFYAYPAPWRYDEAQGFVFNENPWLNGNIVKGAFNGCGTAGVGNKYGNVHALRSDYPNAAVKILLFGSSFTMVTNKDGLSMPDLLEKRLSTRLNKPVSILNFSRDSTGLLTSFDTARAKIPELKPDLVLLVFNSTQLTYPRHWRVVHPDPHQPGMWRMAFSLNPDPKLADGRRTILHDAVISDDVNKEWCEKLTKAMGANDQRQLRNDPLVQRLVASYRSLQRDIGTPPLGIDLYTLKASFAYNRLIRKNPYYGMKLHEVREHFGFANPDYGNDRQFHEAVQAVKSSGIPFLMIHIPILLGAEDDDGYAFATMDYPPAQGLALASSVERITGKKTLHLAPYYDDAAKKRDPFSLVVSKADKHPNSDGTEAMASAMERLLVETTFPASAVKTAPKQ